MKKILIILLFIWIITGCSSQNIWETINNNTWSISENIEIITEVKDDNFTETDALQILVTSDEYINWIIEMKQQRPNNFPVIYRSSIIYSWNAQSYKFELRENNWVINAMHESYLVNRKTGEITKK